MAIGEVKGPEAAPETRKMTQEKKEPEEKYWVKPLDNYKKDTNPFEKIAGPCSGPCKEPCEVGPCKGFTALQSTGRKKENA